MRQFWEFCAFPSSFSSLNGKGGMSAFICRVRENDHKVVAGKELLGASGKRKQERGIGVKSEVGAPIMFPEIYQMIRVL